MHYYITGTNSWVQYTDTLLRRRHGTFGNTLVVPPGSTTKDWDFCQRCEARIAAGNHIQSVLKNNSHLEELKWRLCKRPTEVRRVCKSKDENEPCPLSTGVLYHLDPMFAGYHLFLGNHGEIPIYGSPPNAGPDFWHFFAYLGPKMKSHRHLGQRCSPPSPVTRTFGRNTTVVCMLVGG